MISLNDALTWLIPKSRHMRVVRISNIYAEYVISRRMFQTRAAEALEAKSNRTGDPATLWRLRNPLPPMSETAKDYLSRIKRISSLRTSIPLLRTCGIDSNGIAFVEMEYLKADAIACFSRRNDVSMSLLYQAVKIAAKLHQHGFILGDLSDQSFVVESSGKVSFISILGAFDPGPSVTSQDAFPEFYYYLAPESRQSKIFSFSSDVYSLGVLGLFLLAGRRFSCFESAYVHQDYLETQLKELLNAQTPLPAWSTKLLLSSLNWNPDKRLKSASEMLAYFPGEAQKVFKDLEISQSAPQTPPPTPLLRLSRIMRAQLIGDDIVRLLIASLTLVAIIIFAHSGSKFMRSRAAKAPEVTVSSVLETTDPTLLRENKNMSWSERMELATQASEQFKGVEWKDKLHLGKQGFYQQPDPILTEPKKVEHIALPVRNSGELIKKTLRRVAAQPKYQAATPSAAKQQSKPPEPQREISKEGRIRSLVAEMSNSELEQVLKAALSRNEALLIAVAKEAAKRELYSATRSLFLEFLAASDSADTSFALRRTLGQTAVSGPNKKRISEIAAWTSPLAELALFASIVDSKVHEDRLLALNFLASRELDGEPSRSMIYTVKHKIWRYRSYIVLELGMFGLIEILPPESAARAGQALLPFLGASVFDIIQFGATSSKGAFWCPVS